MKRYRFLVTVMLAAMALIAGCTSSDDAADEPTTATPATTVAPPETATTAASATSTTLSLTAAIATVEAFQEALNAYDSDAALALIADGGTWNGATPGYPNWEKILAEWEAWGHQGTLSDCAVTDGVLTCLETWERTKFGSQGGIIRVSEWEFRFDDQGLIRSAYREYNVSGGPESIAFDRALGAWMATAHPEAHETFFITEGIINREACMNGIDELMPLIDEFVAQSDEYPLSPSVSAATSSAADGEVPSLTFDGESCTYEGPTELKSGSVTFEFVNASDRPLKVNLGFHKGGETVQDMVDYMGPDPSHKHAPWWFVDMGTWDSPIFTEEWPEFAGRSIRWEGDLGPGTYTMVCVAPVPDFDAYFGTGLTVSE